LHSRLLPLVIVGLMAGSAVAETAATRDTDCRRRLLAAITDAVCAHHGVPADRVKITLHTMQLPPGCDHAEHITVHIPEFSDVLGAVSVRATFDGAGASAVTLPVPIRVDLFADVLITARRLSRHDIIRRDDLTWKRQLVTDVAPWVMTAPDSVVGRWADRTINAGQIVDRRWVVAVPLVRRGERVIVAYDAGAVRVSTAAVAVEDGYRGQKIRVKPLAGHQLLTVCVVDERTVRPVP
jgi:flagella basal body P-ring formation protein FlgA